MPKKSPATLGIIYRMPLEDLHPHPLNPYGVRDDPAMQELVGSVKENGVLIPAIARPRKEGGYELISGHRRKYACEQLGQDTMLVMVLNLKDDDAIIRMIDSNIQRENILPSERARAYKLKMEAMKRQGMPKEAYFSKETAQWLGHDRHPAECDCQRAAREKREAAESRQKHLETVEDLKRRGFTDPAMRNWTFEHDNGRNPQTETARFYVESWETMQAENIGYLFWGGVGTGKSYLAACIANALMEKEVAVRMTNFATILNDLAASFEGRNEYISRLCSYPLLILDDFGMERGTEYGLEQVYSVIDSRYRSGKPLIATTNLTLEELQHPQDTPHARIYDRLTSMCAPVRFTGSNFRKETAQEMAIYTHGTRLGLIQALNEMRTYLDEDEQELRTLTDSAVYKLSRITDDAFEKLDLIPEF